MAVPQGATLRRRGTTLPSNDLPRGPARNPRPRRPGALRGLALRTLIAVVAVDVVLHLSPPAAPPEPTPVDVHASIYPAGPGGETAPTDPSGGTTVTTNATTAVATIGDGPAGTGSPGPSRQPGTRPAAGAVRTSPAVSAASAAPAVPVAPEATPATAAPTGSASPPPGLGAGGVSCTYTVTVSSGDPYNARVEADLTNVSGGAWNGWTVALTVSPTPRITTVWGATFVLDGDTVVGTPDEFQRVRLPGQPAKVGFVSTTPGTLTRVDSLSVNGRPCQATSG